MITTLFKYSINMGQIIKQAEMFFATLFAAKEVTYDVLRYALIDKCEFLDYCKSYAKTKENAFIKSLGELETNPNDMEEDEVILNFLLVCYGVETVLEEEKIREYFNGKNLSFDYYKSVFDGGIERIREDDYLFRDLHGYLCLGATVETILDEVRRYTRQKHPVNGEGSCVLL